MVRMVNTARGDGTFSACFFVAADRGTCGHCRSRSGGRDVPLYLGAPVSCLSSSCSGVESSSISVCIEISVAVLSLRAAKLGLTGNRVPLGRC